MTAAAASARLAHDDTPAAEALSTDLCEGISRTATLVRELAYDLGPAELSRVWGRLRSGPRPRRGRCPLTRGRVTEVWDREACSAQPG